MPEVKAYLKHLRIAPRKVRIVADLIRKKNVEEAERRLSFLQKRVAEPFLKLLSSARANAKNNFHMEDIGLYVKEVKVDGGQTLKRYMPRAFGRATPIKKRTSHITLVLDTLHASRHKNKIREQKEKK